MLKVILYVGLNDRISHVQEIPTDEAMEIVHSIIAEYSEGATIYNALGVYKHHDGSIVSERSIRIECIEPDTARLMEAVKILKEQLNQEAIVWENQNVDSVLI